MIKSKGNDKHGWIVGGCTLIGIGVGFIFLSTSTFYFKMLFLVTTFSSV